MTQEIRGAEEDTADEDQVDFRDELNQEIYSFPPEGWSHDDASAGLGVFINEMMLLIDLSAHPKLELGSRQADDNRPKGFIYDDIYDVVLRLFKISYLRSRGCDADG